MDGEDLLARLDVVTKHFEEIIEGDRAKMKAEVDASYNVEKEGMKAVTVNDNIIHLNVGGEKMTTKRSTLCQVEGSLLASMFSGRWEDSLDRDKDGCVFLDFNPKHFGLILDYLRCKRIETPEHPAPLPKVHFEQIMNFSSLVSYLGLEGDLMPKTTKCVFNKHSEGISIEENGAVAVHRECGHANIYEYALSENTYQKGVTHWKLFIQARESVFVGILNENTVPNLPASTPRRTRPYQVEVQVVPYNMAGSLGWVWDQSPLIACKDGKQLYCINQSGELVKHGDTVDLVLNCFASNLSLILPSGQELHIVLPNSELTIWRLFIGLKEHRQETGKIRVLSP